MMNKRRDSDRQSAHFVQEPRIEQKYGADDEQNELRALQSLEWNVLKIIVNICNKNNLQYFLAEGTLLGAIRHQGFIPWDDDVDVCMPREDFSKFVAIASGELPDGYVSRLQNDTGVWGTLRVSDTNHEIRRILDEQELHLFVSVDIFPVDGFPNGKFQQRLHWINVMLRYCLFRAAQVDRVDKRKKHGFFLRCAIKLATLIPVGKLVNEETALRRLTDTLKKYAFSNSDAVMSFYSEYSKRGVRVPSTVMPKTYFGYGRSALFEGEPFSVPTEAEKVLFKEYGDYMVLPPLEERRAKHSMTLIR